MQHAAQIRVEIPAVVSAAAIPSVQVELRVATWGWCVRSVGELPHTLRSDVIPSVQVGTGAVFATQS
jgi:hypothetical protein